MSIGAPQPPRDVSAYGDPRKHGAKCNECPLKGQTFVPFMPPKGKLKLAIVGEGPGRRELIQRTPFVGETGAILNEELEAAGIDRDSAYISNAMLCLAETDKDAERAAECCAPRLLKELEGLPADVPIVPLGKAATRAVLGVKSILLARGFVWTARDISSSVTAAEAALRKAEKTGKKVPETRLRLETLKRRASLAGRTVLPTLHPTFAFIHNETWSPVFRVDMKRIGRFVRGELRHEDLDDRIELVKSLKALRAKRRTFIVTDGVDDIRAVAKVLGKEIACDIETERAKPLSPLTVRILTVQLSDGDRGIVISPWDAARHAKVLTEFLAGRTVVFHNGYGFDHPALERDGVDLSKAKLEDTLIAHHTFSSHTPQKLDHVVAVFCDSSPWKIRFGVRGAEEKGLAPAHADADDLAEYGAADAFVTIKAWRKMQADLADERAVYEHDKQMALQAKGMQVVGIPVDKERKALLAAALKSRAAALKGQMRRICKKKTFAPSKLGEVRRVLFGTLRAPMLNPTASGLASTSNATLEALRTAGAGSLRSGPGDVKRTSGPVAHTTGRTRAARFAEALLSWRVTEKIKSTYLNAVEIHADGNAHYNWRSYGTNSGRYSCRLQSCPRWSKAVEDRPREIYVATPGHSLVYFDLSQAEMRSAAALSNDTNFLKTCEGDVHTGNAKILFPEAAEALERDSKGKYCPKHGDKGGGGGCNCGKPYRDIAKNAGFAVSYLAEAETVFAYLRAHGFPVELDAVEEMLGRLKSSYKGYYDYVAQNVRFIERNGYLRTALTGRIRWFGFHPKPTEASNFPIQSMIADVMNIRTLELQKRIPPTIKMVAQIHDAAIFLTPNELVPSFKEEITKLWAAPVRLEESIVCRKARDLLLPSEIKVGQRWSEL
jgi:uracil-DNA glycosylase family 4